MRKIIGALMLAVAAASATPAAAAGFLQDLFAQAARAAAPPVVYRYAPPPPQMRFVYDQGLRVSPRPTIARKAAKPSRAIASLRTDRKMARVASLNRVAPAAASRVPDRCKVDAATAIERDPTLRVGDAYMTPQGLKVYRGFVDYKKSGIDRGLRARLDAVEQPSNAGAGASADAPRVAATAYVTSASRTDRTSVDAQGRAIRVVGP